eukprot:gene6868-11030_t
MEYFQKLSIPTDFHLELERITGSVFKYMKELSSIDKNLSQHEFIEIAKKNVHSKIERITKNDVKFIEETWQKKVLKGNLFQIVEGNVVFQNRATKEYVKEKLRK